MATNAVKSEVQEVKDTVATVPTMDKACYASKHTFTLPDGSPYSVTVKSFRGSAIASPARQEIADNLWRGVVMALSGLDSINVVQNVLDLRAEVAHQSRTSAWPTGFQADDVVITLNRKLTKSSVAWTLDGTLAMVMVVGLQFNAVATVADDKPID